MSRKIKNAKDLATNELIYFKSHAQATFMSDGTTVEDKITSLESGGTDLTEYVKQEDLATVATSGSYNDLSNKPTIPSAVTESTVSGWGFTKNTGTYSKPSGGIPKSDLNSAVQTSLGKADTALQSYTEQYKGTVTGVKINGTTKNPSSGVVDLGTVITSHQDISGKQDKLVSGTNIKTINGTSILGSGDITISGGSSSGGAYAEVSHGTSDTTFTLTPNVFHVWDEVTELNITLDSEISGVANEYLFQFTSGSEPTTLSLPDDIKWASELVIEPNKIYQISILNGLGTVLEWDNAAIIKDNFIDVSGNILTFEYPTASELTIDVWGRTTGIPSSHILTIPSGVSSYTASNLTTILYINSVTPSSDDKYNYTYVQS